MQIIYFKSPTGTVSQQLNCGNCTALHDSSCECCILVMEKSDCRHIPHVMVNNQNNLQNSLRAAKNPSSRVCLYSLINCCKHFYELNAQPLTLQAGKQHPIVTRK